MHNIVVVVSGSFLSICVPTLRTFKVLDAHMGFHMSFKGTGIGKLLTTKLARFLRQFKLLLFLLCEGALVDLVSQDVSL